MRVLTPRGQPDLSFPAMHDFRSWLRSQGYAPTTIRVYVQYVRRARDHLGSLHRASTEDLERFLATLPPTAASQRQARKALSAYYQYRGRRNPAAALGVPPEPHRLPRPLSEADYTAYIRAAERLGGVYRVVGHMFAFTGCRFVELQQARWRQFDLRSREPSWRVSGKGSARRGKKERVIPLGPSITQTLRWWRTRVDGEYLLPGERTPYITASRLYEVHYAIAEQVGVYAVPHQLRHTVITLALDRTHDPNAVREFAGHSNLSTLQQYSGLLPGRLRAVAEALGA